LWFYFAQQLIVTMS